jgi:hypothetical protein
MKWIPFVTIALVAIPLTAQENAGAIRLAAGIGGMRPPVLRTAEPSDSTVVTLDRSPTVIAVPIPPAPIADDDHRPVLRRAPKPILPVEFEHDSAAFVQKLIGAWAGPDAYNLFGEAIRQRAAVDDDAAENGHIFAYSDPTGRYREIELDFAKDTGLLRTVFVYPWKMTWDQCRHQWGVNVRATEANKGRKFYSYLNRRLDVLVDPAGNVISLGLY